MPIKPWICRGSKTIIKDRWINLHADDCELPDGTKISPFYVNTIPDFVVAVAVTTEEEFIFVRQYRHGTRQILLELPAGCMEASDADPKAGAIAYACTMVYEKPELAEQAKKELLEETGYAGNEPVFLCKVAPNASSLSNFAHCYLITGCRKVREQHLDSTEDIEVVVLSAEETEQLLKDGGLVQAVHVAAMYYAERLLKKNI